MRKTIALAASLSCLVFSSWATAAESVPTEQPQPAPHFVRVGPSVAMGAPGGFSGGLSSTWGKLIGVDVRAGYVPWLALTGTTKMDRLSVEADTRLYITTSAFYVGLVGGYARVDGVALETVGTGTAYAQKATARATSNYAYLRPEVGFQWLWQNGVFVALRAGVDIPIAHSQPSVTLATGNSNYDISNRQNATTAIAFMGSHPLPALTLFELGYML
jgi:hypothetical protein